MNLAVFGKNFWLFLFYFYFYQFLEHQIQKFSNNVDPRKQDFLSAEKIFKFWNNWIFRWCWIYVLFDDFDLILLSSLNFLTNYHHQPNIPFINFETQPVLLTFQKMIKQLTKNWLLISLSFLACILLAFDLNYSFQS